MIATTILINTIFINIPSISGRSLTFQSGHKLSKRSPVVLTFDDNDFVSGPSLPSLLQSHFSNDAEFPSETSRKKRDVKATDSSQSGTIKSKVIPPPHVVS